MSAYLVGYDLSSGTPQDYERLIEVLKSIPGSVDIVQSTWLLNDNAPDAKALSAKLEHYLPKGAKVIVLKMDSEIFVTGLSPEVTQKIQRIFNPLKGHPYTPTQYQT